MPLNRGLVVVDLMEDDNINTSESTITASSPFVSTERNRFLADLNNFLPVGALVLTTPDTDISSWDEVFSSPALVPQPLADDIDKLLYAQRIRVFAGSPSKSVLKIYILPHDVGHQFVQHDRRLDGPLFSLLQNLDISTAAWNGRPQHHQAFGLYATEEDGSLYLMFNSLPSPDPTPGNVKNRFHRAAMVELLDTQFQPRGLKTTLYPYQRRSAALMLERECEGKLELDPRLEARIAVNGSRYFYSPYEISFFQSPRFYESCRGGILAETMGLGKTVICISLILATRGFLPQIPAQYDRVTVRTKVASLVETAISAINRQSMPWKLYFDRHEEYTGEYMGHCIQLLQENMPFYEVPVEQIRWNRNSAPLKPKKMILAATTVVVVPRNLLAQWKSELEKHTTQGSLQILVMDDKKVELPPPRDLANFDVVLFSRPRFEQEDRDGSDANGRRMSRYPVSCNCPYIGATRTRACVCLRPDDLYTSPLKALHFLRIIVDEGHGMAAENTRIASVASKLVEASHRWVVSGTPAKDLVGVEMDLVGPVSHAASPSPFAADDAEVDSESLRRDALLSQRRAFNSKDEKDGAVRSIGSLASSFLKIHPWCPSDEERAADWVDHFFRHEMTRPKMRTFSGFSRCLRRTLESIVIKTQPADVERDIELPPLTHEIVRLEPSFYDKLTVNAFIFVLTANAVTSERTDVDYIFHKNSGKERSQLLANLRTSAFYWTGFTTSDMEAAIEQSKNYIEKRSKLCSKEDEELLKACISQAQVMVGLDGWKALTQSHEVGLFVENWPEASASFWSFDRRSSPLLCGATQLLHAQDHVNQHVDLDPTDGLAGAGLRALSFLRNDTSGTPVLVKAGLPSSSVVNNQVSKPGTTQRPRRSSGASLESSTTALDHSIVQDVQLPVGSALSQTKVVGTTSAKLSYLLSRIEEFHREEKILVFYDSDNVAYYIAQALEVLHVDYLIYARSLAPALKSDYVVRFNQRPEHRVLLMDIGQAAYGLNVSCASRVFFVNPVNRPQVEAQALKRAHRIGQTRQVHAETLILKGTIEEMIFQRARQMSRVEHKSAKELDDDGGIREIIQTARPIPVSADEAPVAFLDKSQQLFARPGWAKWKASALENSKHTKDGEKDGAAPVARDGKRKAPNDEGSSSRKRPRKHKR